VKPTPRPENRVSSLLRANHCPCGVVLIQLPDRFMHVFWTHRIGSNAEPLRQCRRKPVVVAQPASISCGIGGTAARMVRLANRMIAWVAESAMASALPAPALCHSTPFGIARTCSAGAPKGPQARLFQLLFIIAGVYGLRARWGGCAASGVDRCPSWASSRSRANGNVRRFIPVASRQPPLKGDRYG
jgi:hypothetical protein